MEVKPRGFVDYTGFKTGKVTVLSFDSWHVQPSGQRKSKWKCLCECGNEFVAMGTNLKKENHTTSCGCEQERKLREGHANYFANLVPTDLKGVRFGRLEVLNFSRWDRLSDDQQVSVWDCKCDCGNLHTTRRMNLGDHSSCGCWFREKISESSTKHGMSGTPTHKSWVKMKERCYLESYKEKEYYQDLNIEVCERWLESFENFLEDMGERPEGKTLDRIDYTLGYYKENCRWADLTVQSYNRRMGSNNTSGRVGVFQLRNGNWQAIISHYKERIVLAYDVSFEEACSARREAEIEYYGQVKDG